MQLSRRTFVSTLAASSLLGTKLGASVSKGDKSVIWLWLGGGISATEFINPIPSAPIEYRSVTGHVDTKSGYQLGGNFVNLAKISDKITPVRSFAHKDGSHSTATGWVMSGHPYLGLADGSPQKEPSYGSIISALTQPSTPDGIPTYVKVQKIEYDGAVWLGSKHVGYEASGDGVKNLKANVENAQFARRMEMVRLIDRKGDELYKSWSELREQSYNIVIGTASKVFELKQEPQQILNKYNVGKSSLGESLLLARRLVQAGSKFITVHHGGWDMHSDIKVGFDRLAPDVDYSLYTLVQELEMLDLLQNTMIVITSEFSRTPKLNSGLGASVVPGRDHWPSVVPLMLIGGEYTHGNVVGTTNGLAEYPTSAAFGPKDLTNTIFDHFNLDKRSKITDNTGRPHYFVEEDSRCILT